jgi:endonuclease YncB( thermonuclease family)
VSSSGRIVTFVVLSVLTGLLAVGATAGDYARKGTVTHVVDGDTLDVRLVSGKSERVRVIGIDTPERGVCWASQATDATRGLAQGKRVTLVSDPTQDTRDRYGRLLAYVTLPGGSDLGYQLVAGGNAKVYVYNRPFKRLSAYRNGEALGKAKGLWNCGSASASPSTTGATSTTPAPQKCHPSYTGACLDPSASDYDCAGGSGNGPLYTGPVRVVGPDVFRLDADGDGYGCKD